MAVEKTVVVPIAQIEDLCDAVYGAGLEATQMSTGGLSGSLVFAEKTGLTVTSGLIIGHVALTGPLSLDNVTIGIGLHIGRGSRHWLNEVETGDVGVFHPGDEHDSLYARDSLYAAVTLSTERLEDAAAREDLVLDRKCLGGTGFHPRHVSAPVNSLLRQRFERVHAGGPSALPGEADLCDTLLAVVIRHYARDPFPSNRRSNVGRHAKVVTMARAYILEHLSEPLSLDRIAAAACTSKRTLQRAFAEILNESPQTFVRKIRLHRIRHDIADDAERACTIALIANQWGISELGRMSRWYRDLFGERPSETLARPPSPAGRKVDLAMH